MKRAISIIAVLLVALLAPTAGANDPAVGVDPAPGTSSRAVASALQLNVFGSPANDEISVTLDATQTQYVITTSTQLQPPSTPCSLISPTQITCPIENFVSISAELGNGKDQFTVGPSVKLNATIAGGKSADALRGGGGIDTLIGGKGRDRMLGNNARDTLRGGDGGDVLNGGPGRDLLNGGKGGDTLRGGPGRDIEKQ